MIRPDKRELLGPLQPDDPGQKPRATEVDGEAPLHEDLGESRPVGGNHEIAAECQVEAGAHCHPVDGGDRRLGQSMQCERRGPDLFIR